MACKANELVKNFLAVCGLHSYYTPHTLIPKLKPFCSDNFFYFYKFLIYNEL